ncbi:MAG: IPT/TIG domain-containing protein [Kofleriaceae bacterium]
MITAEITITGERFGEAQGAGSVSFGGLAATITSWSDTSIVAVVPDRLPGAAPVVVATQSGQTDPRAFRVTLRPAVYLNNDSDDAGTNTLSMLAMDLASGTLTEITPPTPMGVATSGYGGCAQSIWVHEGTRRLFATGANAVAVFDIHPVTGALTPVIGSPFVTGDRSFGVVTNTAGTRAFVANYGSSDISVFDVASNGALTGVPGSPFATTHQIDTLAIGLDDRFLFGNSYSSTFDVFAIASDGSLSPVDGLTRQGGTTVAIRPGYNQLFVPLIGGLLGVWNIDPLTGVATEATETGSPFALNPPMSSYVDSPVFSVTGDRLYLAPDNGGSVLGFSLDDAGTPTPINGSPWESGGITDMACEVLSRDGTMFLSIGETDKSVAVFKFVGDTPSQVVGSPFTHTTPNSNASGIAITF